jgi:hypothetical protein
MGRGGFEPPTDGLWGRDSLSRAFPWSPVESEIVPRSAVYRTGRDRTGGCGSALFVPSI